MCESVIKILEEYITWEKYKKEKSYNNLSDSERNKIRLEYDHDAKYYYEVMKLSKEKSLYGDTIISFWTPFKRLLECEANWYAYKTESSLNALLYQIKTDKKTDFSEKIKKIICKIEPFAEVCYTKGNYMLLPNRKMNIERYAITEDRIDMTIYECFEKGALSKFFKSDDELIKWIKTQKLDFLFSKVCMTRESIKWFIKNDKQKVLSKMNAEEIYQYLTSSINLINYRNQ